MPPRRRNVRKTKPRKAFRKSRRTKRRTYTNKVRTVGPIAPRTITKLRYFQSFQSGLILYDSQLRLNSTYDPDFTGGGHQPYGRDTYAGIYAKYRVFGVSYRIRASTSSNDAINISIVPNNSASAYTNPTLAAESPRAINRLVGYGNPVILQGYLNLPSLTGVTSATYKGDYRYGADIGSDPAEIMNLHIVTSTMGGGTTDKVQYVVELNYHVEFYDPFELAQS